MAQKFLNVRHDVQSGYPIIGKNSTQFSQVDPVVADSSGWLDIAGTTTKVLGFSTDDRTMASTNQTVAKIKPTYVPSQGVLAQITADQAVTQTDIGAYADTGTATTGAFVVNLVAGTSGQFHVLGAADPDSLTTDCVVEVAEPQSLGFTQD